MDLKNSLIHPIFIKNNNKESNMGILENYKKMLEAEKEQENMDFPTGTNLSEKDREAYESALKKIRNADFSQNEVEEAINNSRKNMAALGDVHVGGKNEKTMTIAQSERITDKQLMEMGLLDSKPISDIRVIRAYCPKCGKELVAKAPAMYNPFTLEKMCLHECCDTRFNLDKPYPHIAFLDEDGNEIISYGI